MSNAKSGKGTVTVGKIALASWAGSARENNPRSWEDEKTCQENDRGRSQGKTFKKQQAKSVVRPLRRDLSKRSTCLSKVEVIGKSPATASCIMFVLLPRTADSHMPIAPQATEIRWWKWVRTDSMGVWKDKKHVEWDAPTKEAEGAESRVWEAMLELLNLYELEAGPEHPAPVTILIGPQKTFENVQMIDAWNG